jgi:hypothetical protein
VTLRPYSRIELACTWLALSFAAVAFFLDSLALIFIAGLSGSFSAALTVARIVLEEVDPGRTDRHSADRGERQQ